MAATSPSNPRKVSIDKYVALIESEQGKKMDWRITEQFNFVLFDYHNRKAEYHEPGNVSAIHQLITLNPQNDTYYFKLVKKDKRGVTQYYHVMIDWFL